MGRTLHKLDGLFLAVFGAEDDGAFVLRVISDEIEEGDGSADDFGERGRADPVLKLFQLFLGPEAQLQVKADPFGLVPFLYFQILGHALGA